MSTIGRVCGLDRLAGLVDEELHAIEFLKEIVREFDVGLVDFVDQQNRALRRRKCIPEFAPLDVVGDVLDAFVAELAVAQSRNRVVLVKTLLRLCRRFDVPFDEWRTEGSCNFGGEYRFARPGFALDQQRTLEPDRSIDGDLQVVRRNV